MLIDAWPRGGRVCLFASLCASSLQVSVLACLPLSEALSGTWLASTDPSLSEVDVLGPILR